jgi:hypothetical protein
VEILLRHRTRTILLISAFCLYLSDSAFAAAKQIHQITSVEELASIEGSPRVQQMIEKQVRKCMKLQGFDFVATPTIDFDLDKVRSASGAIQEEAFRKEFGWGIFTLLPAQAGAPALPVRKGNDLTTAEQQLYKKALYGDQTGNGKKKAGCVREAKAKVVGDPLSLKKLREEAKSLRSKIENMPEVLAELDGWRRCMAVQGFRFQHPNDIGLALMKKYNDERGAPGFSLENAAIEERSLGKVWVACSQENLRVRTKLTQKGDAEILQRYKQDLLKFPMLVVEKRN